MDRVACMWTRALTVVKHERLYERLESEKTAGSLEEYFKRAKSLICNLQRKQNPKCI